MDSNTITALPSPDHEVIVISDSEESDYESDSDCDDLIFLHQIPSHGPRPKPEAAAPLSPQKYGVIEICDSDGESDYEVIELYDSDDESDYEVIELYDSDGECEVPFTGISLTKGWNLVFNPTDGKTELSEIESLCISASIYSVTDGKLTKENGIYPGGSYLLRAGMDCFLNPEGERVMQEDIRISEGWNIFASQNAVSMESIKSACTEIIVYKLDKGRIVRIDESESLRRDNAYLLRSKGNCIILAE